VLTCLQQVSQLTRESGLTRTLQTRHQDDGRTILELQLYSLTTHQLSQLVMNQLHHQLSGLDGREHIHTQRLLLDSIRKRLGHLVVDIGIQQGFADILHGLRHIDFGDFSFTFQYLERPFKSVTKILEHIYLIYFRMQRYE